MDGHKNLFTCRFHGWSFDPDGNVVSRPQEACFHSDTSDNKSDFTLTELPVSETCGVVIIGLKKDIGVEPADAGYESLASELQNYNLKTYKALERKEFNVAANWKLINDLSLESYHFGCVLCILKQPYVLENQEQISCKTGTDSQSQC